MQKATVILTDSNTLKQIRPMSGIVYYERFVGMEVKSLMDKIEDLAKKGQATVENKIKREGISYGLYSVTGYWYPAIEISSDSIVDVPYGAISINLSIANPTNKLDVNRQENWDKGLFDLEARVLRIEKPEEDSRSRYDRLLHNPS